MVHGSNPIPFYLHPIYGEAQCGTTYEVWEASGKKQGTDLTKLEAWELAKRLMRERPTILFEVALVSVAADEKDYRTVWTNFDKLYPEDALYAFE